MICAEVDHRCMTSSAAPITIRRATGDDARALHRLAALDSRRLPAGPHLIARQHAHGLVVETSLVADAPLHYRRVPDFLHP